MSADKAVLVDMVTAAQLALGDRVNRAELERLDAIRLRNLARRYVERLSAVPRQKNALQVAGHDMLDARLGRIILDGVNHDIRVGQAMRALLRYFRHDFPLARARSRARRLNINLAAAGPDVLAPLLKENNIPVVAEVISQIKAVRRTDPAKAAAFAASIADEKMTPAQSLFVAFTLHAGGEVVRPARLLENVRTNKLNAGQLQRLNRIVSEARIMEFGPAAVADTLVDDLRLHMANRGRAHMQAGQPFRMAYVAASTLPYNKVGYTTRTHRIVRAIDVAADKAGADLLVVARPGFPFDRFDLDASSLGIRRYSVVDGIRYTYLDNPVPMQDSLIAFARSASLRLAEMFADNGVGAVTAASNHVNAFSAMIAARSLGLPFTYEVRGLWEETRASKVPGWNATERFAVERMMERFVIEAADTTFFITRQVREIFFGSDEATSGGSCATTSARRSYLAPNCAVLGEDRPVVSAYDGVSREVIELFYVGSLVEYEGLQTLLEALFSMADRDNYRLTVVGGGKYAAALREMAVERGLTDIVTFTGRVDPSQVAQYFDRADVVMVPRLPHRVCQLVSPLKPLEAMSYGRVCLASDVAPMADLIADSETGFLFNSGDAESLAQALRRVHDAQPSFPAIAEAANRYLERNRDWRDIGERVFTANLESALESTALESVADTSKHRSQTLTVQ